MVIYELRFTRCDLKNSAACGLLGDKKLRMMRSPLVQNTELTSAKQKAPGMPGRGKRDFF